MIDLSTTYMGLSLGNPVILGSSNLVRNTDTLKRAEDLGVGAIVYKSLFEEEIQLESFQLEERLTEFNDLHAEMATIHPNIEHSGPDEHLLNISKARESLSIPLIASLNATNDETWVKYARLLAETGVNAIELNFYQIPVDFNKSATEIEEAQINTLKEVRKSIKIPISVKLSPDYSNVLNFVKKLDDSGADAFVLFNSFFQPDINVDNEKHVRTSFLSQPGDYKKSLRYAGLLSGKIKGDICSSVGISDAKDVIKFLLSGADCVQVVSTVYRNGLIQISTIIKELEEWMKKKNYMSIDEFQGKLSKEKLTGDPFVYKRAQYVDLLLNSENIILGGTNSRTTPY